MVWQIATVVTEASHTLTVIGSVDLDSQIDEYHTGVAQFRHVACVTVALCEDSDLLRCRYSLLQQMLIVGHSVNFSG